MIIEREQNTLHRTWIPLLIAGLASLIFGAAIFAIPAISLMSFLWVRAAYMVIKGLALTIVVLRAKRKESYWDFLLCFELMSIVASIVAASYSGISTYILGFIISINLLLSGIIQVVMAFRLPREVHRRGLLIASGAITFLAGIYIYTIERISADAILILLAIDSFALGYFFISVSLAVRKMVNSPH